MTTSYDYDAPLSEAGDPTEKLFAIRTVISKVTNLAGIRGQYWAWLLVYWQGKGHFPACHGGQLTVCCSVPAPASGSNATCHPQVCLWRGGPAKGECLSQRLYYPSMALLNCPTHPSLSLQYADLLDVLDVLCPSQPVQSQFPLTFEALKQVRGWV